MIQHFETLLWNIETENILLNTIKCVIICFVTELLFKRGKGSLTRNTCTTLLIFVQREKYYRIKS